MERHDPQERTQPGTQGSSESEEGMRRKLAELDQMLAGVRDSLERMKESVGHRTEERMATRDAGEAGQAAQGQRPGPGQERGEERAAQGEKAEREQAGGEGAASGEQQREGAEQETAAGEGEERETEDKEGAPEAEGEEAKEKEGQKTLTLFDGGAESLKAWKKVGGGDLQHREDQMRLAAEGERGLAYFSAQRFDDFLLKLSYRLDSPDAAMTAALRFLDPEQPVPDREEPEKKYRYDNKAYVASHTGFEVRLGSSLDGEPGTFVDIPVGDEAGKQSHPQKAELKHDDWNELEVEVRGNDYTVRLNGAEPTRFTNPDEWRGRPAAKHSDAGFLGLLMREKPRRRAVQPGPMVPGRQPKKDEGEGAGLAIRRIEVQMLGKERQPSEEKKERARKDLAALHEEVRGALAKLKAKDQGLEGALEQAYGYAVIPSIGRASIVLGFGRGYGEVFERGKPVGFTRVTQMTVGVQVGGQTLTQLLLFGSKESLEAFKSSPIGFCGNLSAAFVKGATGMANFKDVTAHAYSRGGMVLEATLGGQKYRFMREDEAIKELAEKHEEGGVKDKLANVGGAVKSMAGDMATKLGKKAGVGNLAAKVADKLGAGTAREKVTEAGSAAKDLAGKVSSKTGADEATRKVGGAAKGLAGKVSSKIGGLFQGQDKSEV